MNALTRQDLVFFLKDNLDVFARSHKDTTSIGPTTMMLQLLSFMDLFSRYNQIKMNELGQEKTSFVTSQSIFCYTVMPFGLKYQRLVKKMFKQQIGWNIEVYVDGMIV